MKKILNAIKKELKAGWDFLMEPVVFRNSFWYAAFLLFCDIVGNLIVSALVYYYF